jgi:hypothetical protein
MELFECPGDGHELRVDQKAQNTDKGFKYKLVEQENWASWVEIWRTIDVVRGASRKSSFETHTSVNVGIVIAGVVIDKHDVLETAEQFAGMFWCSELAAVSFLVAGRGNRIGSR